MKNQNIGGMNHGGSFRCPACLGLGFVATLDINCVMSLVNQSVCPSCGFYKNENSCTAWKRTGESGEGERWVFDGENSCDILRTITRALRTIGMTKSAKSGF